jgi:hypothetical protein
MDTRVAVSNRAWLELLHAEACWALRQANVHAMIIKGPSIAEWLYPDEPRESVDADLLIDPAHWDDALEALHQMGFEDSLERFKDGEAPEHSVTLIRTDPHVGRHSVDLHRYFPGLDADPGDSFSALLDRRVIACQAGVDVWFPDLPSRALIIALHAARDPWSLKTAEDLRRAWHQLTRRQKDELAELAVELSAQPALRAGLETLPETTGAVEDLGLGDIEVPAYWALRGQKASGTAIHIQQVSGLPWHRRPTAAIRWLFPSPALMRVRDPQLKEGAIPLTSAYVSRLSSGIRALPQAIRDVRRAGRSTNRNE